MWLFCSLAPFPCSLPPLYSKKETYIVRRKQERGREGGKDDGTTFSSSSNQQQLEVERERAWGEKEKVEEDAEDAEEGGEGVWRESIAVNDKEEAENAKEKSKERRRRTLMQNLTIALSHFCCHALTVLLSFFIFVADSRGL